MSVWDGLIRKPVPVLESPSKRPKLKKPRRPRNTMPTSFQLSEEHRQKLRDLGGVRWIRKQLDAA